MVKKVPNLETEKLDTICLEIIIAKTTWCILFAYRPPTFSKTDSFDVIYVMLKKTLNKYNYYLLLPGKLKINILTPTSE